MLSEAEKQRLSEIESQLRADDPVFVQGFDDRGQRRLRPGWRTLAAMLAVAVAMTTAGVGLVLGSVRSVVVALTIIGATAGMWITHGRRP